MSRPAAARLALAAVLPIVLGGCGLLSSLGIGSADEGDGAHRADESIHEVAGGRVMALHRPTRGLVHLSLWIDAGSRDAEPPQVATAAAWIAAGRAGDRVHAEVFPDGTVYELLCERDGIGACVRALGRALSMRDPTEEEVVRSLRRLTRARRRAAADEGRTADALALRALLGEGAAGMGPLGQPDDDDAVDGAAVARFVERTHGPTRALVVAAGDVDGDALEEAVGEEFEEAPAARAERAERPLDVLDEPAPVVEVGESNTVAVATAARDLAHAAALARAVAGESDDDSAAEVVHAFAVRGGALVIARGAGDDGAAVAGDLLYAVRRARAEGLAPDTLAADSDPVAAAHAAGMAWLAEGGETTEPSEAVGVGAVVRGGRGDVAGASEGDDPDAAVRSRAVARLERAARSAKERVSPETRGTVGERAASVVTDNGARIDVRRRPGDRRVAVAIRLAGGAAADPPALHGRAAVLATAAASSCDGLGPGGLDARLGAMEATLAPSVDDGSWGVVIEAPRARWAAALDLGLRCALHPSLSRADVERARLTVLDRLEGRGELAAWAALAVAPEAPGAVAPLGAVEPVLDLPVSSVRHLHAESLVGARVAVAVVGDVPVDDAVARVARRVAVLPAGTAAPGDVAVRTPSPQGPLSVEHDGVTPRVVIAWRAPAPDARPLVARAFAAAVGEALGSTPGMRLVWTGGATHDGTAWAAIALDAHEDALADLPRRVASAVAAAGDDAVANRVQRLRRSDARLRALPAVAADRLARGRLAPGNGPHRRGAGGSTAAALGAASPRFVVGRPR